MSLSSKRFAPAFVLFWALALPAAAQDVCAGRDFGTRLTKRYTAECWNRVPQLVLRADAIDKQLLGKEGIERIRAAGGSVEAEVTRLPGPGAQPESAPYVAKLAARAGAAVAQLQDLPGLDRIDDENGAKYSALQITYWEPVDTRDSLGENYLEDRGCADKDVSNETCAAVYAKATEIADATFVVRYIIDSLREPNREELRKALAQRTARWRSYLYDSQFQYWWELGFNRWLEGKCPSGLNGVVAGLLKDAGCRGEATDPYGNKIEWREPQRFRSVLLHPEIGFMYKRDEPDGQRIKPSLVFQWFGYQWWRWGEDNRGTSVQDLRGLSLVSTVTDTVAGEPVGLGIQLQYDEYALAVTSHGGKPVFTFSVDLVGKVSKLDEEYVRRLTQRNAKD